MKKELLIGCLFSMLIMQTTQAIEIKKPSLTSIKSAVSTSTTEAKKLSAEEIAIQKQFQANITAAQNKINNAATLADTAKWELASILLSADMLDNFKQQQIEIKNNKELSNEDKENALQDIESNLIKALNAELKSKQFDSEKILGNNAENYKTAVKNLQIANNRYENTMNALSPNFKKILDGKISATNVVTELKDSGKITLNAKKQMMEQSALLNNLKKINAQNSIFVEIPETEKVIYNKEGVVGSINYQLDTTNSKVKNSYKELINAFNLKEEIAAKKAEITNNPNLTEIEKQAALKKVATDEIAKALQEKTIADENGKIKELTVAERTAIINSTAILTEAVLEYTELGITCTMLGMKIAKNPLLGAPLALEVGQLKYTAKILKDSASSLKNVTGQMIKVAKANNIALKLPEEKNSKIKKISLPIK